MNPFGTRARSDELAALLDGAVAGPGTLTAPYAGLATRIRSLSPALDALAAPSAEFRAALRQRLVAVATVQAAAEVPYAEPVARPVAWVPSLRAQRRIGVAAGAMASVVAITGVGVAATRSLPGQPFYAVKRLSETVQLDLASGDTAKGTKHLEFAATRLREVRALVRDEGSLSLGPAGTPSAAGLALGGSKDSHIASALADFDSETRAGSSLLTKVYDKTGKPAPLRILTSFTSEQKSRLSALLPALPDGLRDEAQSSLALVTSVATQATDKLALGTCGGSCYPGNAGPALPTQPEPTPGATATPSESSDNNGVPACSCGQPTLAPSPTTAPAPSDSPSPAPSAQPAPSQQPTPEPTASPSPSASPAFPVPLPSLPVPLPTLPVPLPTLPVPPAVATPVASLLGLPKS